MKTLLTFFGGGLSSGESEMSKSNAMFLSLVVGVPHQLRQGHCSGQAGGTARVSIQLGSMVTVPEGDDHFCLGVRFERIRVQKNTCSCTRRSALQNPRSAHHHTTIIRSASECEFQRPSWLLSFAACGPRAATSNSRVAMKCVRTQVRARW